MLVGALVLEIALDELGASAVRITTVENVKQHIRTVNDLVQLLPNALRTTLEENSVLNLVTHIFHLVLVQVLVVGGIILDGVVADLREHLIHVRRANSGSLATRRRSEGVLELLDLQQSLALRYRLVERLFDKVEWQLLVANEHGDARASLLLLLLQLLSVLLELFLVDCAHISEPFAIGLNAARLRVRRPLLHLRQVGLGLVHVQSVDGLFRTEL